MKLFPARLDDTIHRVILLLALLPSCDHTATDEGAAGSGGGQHVNGPSCYHGNVLFLGPDCKTPPGTPNCSTVVDIDNNTAFKYCDTDPALLFLGDCGAFCSADRCCHKTSGNGLQCADLKVCEEGVALGKGYYTYTDRTKYEGQPIPLPVDCAASVTKIGTCAPNCGSCTDNEICSGRSPTHPLGVCFPAEPAQIFSCGSEKNLCLASELCLFFDHVPPESVDGYIGVCIPADACLQLARYLPGGAYCHDTAGNTVSP